MNRPRVLKMTTAQERAAEQGERLLCRSQILRAGVHEMLGQGWPGPFDLDIAVEILTEALAAQREGYALMSRAKPAPIGKAKRA